MPDEKLDKILNPSLERYSAIEPLAGLEQRIMQRLLAERAMRSKFGSRWAVVFTCATVLTAIVVLTSVRHQVTPAQTELAGTLTPPTLPLLVPQQRFPSPSILQHVSSRNLRQRLPKQDNFPLRTPMTTEERAVLKLATYSKTALSGLDKDAEPIQIAPVELQPIAIDSASDQERSSGYVE